jgi:hypothetical protein
MTDVTYSISFCREKRNLAKETHMILRTVLVFCCLTQRVYSP